MEKNDFLFIELNKEFEHSVERLKKSSYTSESSINRYRRYAELRVKKYAAGYYINDKGKRVNSAGELIKEFDKLNAKKNRTIYILENKMDNYVDDNENRVELCGQIRNYLKLFFVCQQWGNHLINIGKQPEGCKYLLSALKFVNMWSGAMVAFTLDDRYEQQSKNIVNAAREGGKGRAKSYAPIKAKVVELLNKNVPEGGWETKVAAINALETGINQFLKDKDLHLKLSTSWDKIHKSIYDWSRNDKTVKIAFDAVVQKKKKCAQKGAG